MGGRARTSGQRFTDSLMMGACGRPTGLPCGDLRSVREDRQTPFGPALISAGPNGWSAGGRDDQATESAGSVLSSLLSAFTMTVTRTVARAISPAPTAKATW